MNDATKCAQCGCDVPVGFPPGVCPTCLLKQAMSPSTFNSALEPRSPSRSRRWTPPSPAELAPRFPQLEIVELLGQGATGAVYKVRQLDLDRWAALKILSDDVAEDASFAERFQREARALALLGHPHIVIVYEFGQRNGVYFLLMEYVDGVNLRQAIRAQQITAHEALAIVTQICDALQFAHEEGVIHRDIKPENILVDKRGRVKIADFGLAKLLGRSFEVPTLTGTHQVMGTPVYMSPEQMEGTRAVDHRADIFSLGVVFYELLTGELPLGRFAPPSQKYQLDIRLDDVVLRSLEKEPDRRYQKASDVRSDIDSIRKHQPIAHPAEQRKDRSRSRGQRRFSMLRAVLMCLTIICFVEYTVLFLKPFEAPIFSQHRRVVLPPGNDQQRYVSSVVSSNSEVDMSAPRGMSMGGMAALAYREPVEMVVLLTSEAAKLSPRVGAHEQSFLGLSDAHRQRIDQILTTIHLKYLAVERQNTRRVIHPGGTQESIIADLSLDRAMLEQELWRMVDADFSAEIQKFVRRNLPLYTDIQRQIPEIFLSDFADASGTIIRGKDLLSGKRIFPFKMQYPQLLGWKQVGQELHISISKTSFGFRWNLTYEFRDFVDTGEASELPVGLRRFWNAPSGDTQSEAESEAKSFASGRKDLFYSPLATSEGLMPVDESSPDFGDDVVLPDPQSVDPSEPQSAGDPVTQETPTAIAPSAYDLTLDEPLQIALSRLEGWGVLHEQFDDPLIRQKDLSQFQRQVEVLLARHTKPSERGEIHLKVVQVYLRNRVENLTAEIKQHAAEGLKRLRTPLERSDLFLALGGVAAIESPTEAARWYLKGYAELLPFQLPDVAPEFSVLDESPVATASGDAPVDFNSNVDRELTEEQVEADVRRETLERVRAQVEFTRSLISRRDAYVERLKASFVNANQSDDLWFVELAEEVLPNLGDVTKLIKKIESDLAVQK